jgi:SAM-dependent methyltransferase
MDLDFSARDSEMLFKKRFLSRNGWKNEDYLSDFLRDQRRVLDAGCNQGRATSFMRWHSNPSACEIIGLSIPTTDLPTKNFFGWPNLFFVKADPLADLKAMGKFDFILCQGEFLEYGNAIASFRNLVRTCLEDGGIIAVNWDSSPGHNPLPLLDVREWFENENLEIIHEVADSTGLTIHGVRNP